jgi:hypothetical protein
VLCSGAGTLLVEELEKAAVRGTCRERDDSDETDAMMTRFLLFHQTHATTLAESGWCPGNKYCVSQIHTA